MNHVFPEALNTTVCTFKTATYKVNRFKLGAGLSIIKLINGKQNILYYLMLDAKVTKKIYTHLAQNHHTVQALQKNNNKTNCCNYLNINSML